MSEVSVIFADQHARYLSSLLQREGKCRHLHSAGRQLLRQIVVAHYRGELGPGRLGVEDRHEELVEALTCTGQVMKGLTAGSDSQQLVQCVLQAVGDHFGVLTRVLV